MSRKTYEKIAIINGMFNVLEQQIIHKVDVFESDLPFTWVYDENGLSDTMKSISVPLQYLIAAALEVTDVNIFKPSGFTMGMNNWNIAQLRIFWQYCAIVRKEAL